MKYCRKVLFLSTSPAWGTTYRPGVAALILGIFLSTSPAWGTTDLSKLDANAKEFLSTSPAWGTTIPFQAPVGRSVNFYPRPPRGGRRWHPCGPGHRQCGFLSTSPAWGTTFRRHLWRPCFPRISIHVPRVGDDQRNGRRTGQNDTFLSTSPAWGTTPSPASRWRRCGEFLSTSPAWGTTGAAGRLRR